MRSLVFILILLIPTISLPLFFSSCSTKEKQAEVIDQRFLPVQASFYGYPNIHHPTSLIGDWNYSFPFYSRGLEIRSDSTFIFEARGCLGMSYSEGNWTANGKVLHLKSYERFRPNPDIPNHGLWPDTAKMYFDFVTLRLEGDTLYELDVKGFRTTTTYALVNR